MLELAGNVVINQARSKIGRDKVVLDSILRA
jgi:hypothetical protein